MTNMERQVAEQTSTNTITIDGKQYETASLPENAKAQVVNLRFVDDEIRRIEASLAVFRTARSSYARALKSELDKLDAGSPQA